MNVKSLVFKSYPGQSICVVFDLMYYLTWPWLVRSVFHLEMILDEAEFISLFANRNRSCHNVLFVFLLFTQKFQMHRYIAIFRKMTKNSYIFPLNMSDNTRCTLSLQIRIVDGKFQNGVVIRLPEASK